jgi:hypothetical protein
LQVAQAAVQTVQAAVVLVVIAREHLRELQRLPTTRRLAARVAQVVCLFEIEVLQEATQYFQQLHQQAVAVVVRPTLPLVFQAVRAVVVHQAAQQVAATLQAHHHHKATTAAQMLVD